MQRPRAPGIGAIVLACWALHALSHARRGTAHDLLWACNVAILVLAIGCFTGRGRLCAVAIMWLTFGLPMWLIDVACSGTIMATSVLTHVGCLALGGLAVRKLGWPKRSWLFATAASVLLLAVTRIVSSPAYNLNLAFRVYPGWPGSERHFSSHAVYLAALLAGSSLVFWIVERVARRFVVPDAVKSVDKSEESSARSGTIEDP